MIWGLGAAQLQPCHRHICMCVWWGCVCVRVCAREREREGEKVKSISLGAACTAMSYASTSQFSCTNESRLMRKCLVFWVTSHEEWVTSSKSRLMRNESRLIFQEICCQNKCCVPKQPRTCKASRSWFKELLDPHAAYHSVVHMITSIQMLAKSTVSIIAGSHHQARGGWNKGYPCQREGVLEDTLV